MVFCFIYSRPLFSFLSPDQFLFVAKRRRSTSWLFSNPTGLEMELAIFLYGWRTSTASYLVFGSVFQVFRLAFFRHLVFARIFFIHCCSGRVLGVTSIFFKILFLVVWFFFSFQFLASLFRQILPSRYFYSILGTVRFFAPFIFY